MFIYNVTVKVEQQRAEEWLEWMRKIHIPEVMETGFFVANKICRIINEDPEDFTFAVQYTCNNFSDYELYHQNNAPQLQKSHTEKFGTDAFAFRTLMEILA